jgi:hypothetical protein
MPSLPRQNHVKPRRESVDQKIARMKAYWAAQQHDQSQPSSTDYGAVVRTIARRLQKLERGFGLGPETEDDRRLRERLETARRRAAERRAREGLPPLETDDQREDLRGLTIVEILQRGRARAHARNEHA